MFMTVYAPPALPRCTYLSTYLPTDGIPVPGPVLLRMRKTCMPRPLLAIFSSEPARHQFAAFIPTRWQAYLIEVDLSDPTTDKTRA